ncbi:MAG: enoyl-CoA hydratase-related protein, partial [Syntrophales bacterium]|nr:enoyl-CoA hydratase-related protein [Syntrophales bacterium]
YIANITHYGGACKLVYTGEPIDAAEALRIGLIDEIVTRDKLMERSIALAKGIASKPPLALMMAKRCMVKAQEGVLEEGLKYEEGILAQLWESNDKNEAVKSFLEKRKPVFTGK